MLQCPIDGSCPCHTLSQAEDKLAAAKAVVERLTLETHRLKYAVNAFHDPLIHLLPRELASQIFTLCIPPTDQRLLTRSNQTRFSSSASILSLVCSAWRDIACSTPQLWNVLSMRLRAPESVSILQHTESFLSRSRSLPLIIRIDTHKYEDLPYFPSATFYPIIDALNLHWHRWHTLELCIPFSLTSKLHCGSHGEESLLQNLSIKVPSQLRGSRSRTGFGSTSRGLVRPAMVNICGLHLKAVQIDWSQVTQVEFDTLSVRECLELLSSAPKLERLDINFFHRTGTSEDGPFIPVTHHSLETLDCPFGSLTAILFDKLVLPGLEDLNIKGYGPYDSLERLLMRSSYPLVKFHLEETRSDSWSLIPLLRAMPDLEEIFLWDLNSYMEIRELCDLMKNTTAFMVESDPSTLFLPRLESFQYHGCPRLLWATIPSWFPPVLESPGTLYRPLSSFSIWLEIHPLEVADYYIDRDSLPGLIDLSEEMGSRFSIKNIHDELSEDIIEGSRKYHNLLDVESDSDDEEGVE